MSFKDTLESLPGKVLAFLEALPAEAQAKLPLDAKSNLTALVGDAADEAKALASAEVASAAAKLPPELEVLGPLLAGLVDKEIDRLQAEAADQVAKLTAAKAALPTAA